MKEFYVKTKDLKEGIEKVYFLESKEKYKVYFFITNNTIEIINTGLYTIASFIFYHNNQIDNDIDFCINNKDLKNLYKMIKKDCKGVVYIVFDKDYVIFQKDNDLLKISKESSKIEIKNIINKFSNIDNQTSATLYTPPLIEGLYQFIELANKYDLNSDYFGLRFYDRCISIMNIDNYLFYENYGDLSIHILMPFIIDFKEEYIIRFRVKEFLNILKHNKDRNVIFTFNNQNNERPVILKFKNDYSSYNVVPYIK